MADAVFRGIEKAWPAAERILPEVHRRQIREQMEAVREAGRGGDPYRLKAEMDKLGELTRPLADAIMSQAALSELRKFVLEHGSPEPGSRERGEGGKDPGTRE